MKLIHVDFNARTEDDRIRLDTAGARVSLAAAGIGPQRPWAPPWVWLTDGELRVPARLMDVNDQPVARPLWDALEDVPQEETPRDRTESERALHELREMERTQNWNYRRLFRILPLAERLLPADSGHSLYLRSRAFQALGYPELALAVIEEVLEQEPQNQVFQHHRYGLLRELESKRTSSSATLAPRPALSLRGREKT